MCEPTTLLIAATAVTAAGTAYGGYQAYQNGRYQNEVAKNNATMERDAAYDAEVQGQRAEQVKWREIAATRSAQIAAFAANGFDTSFGSVEDVVGDTLKLGMEDAQTIRENAAREARGHLISSQNYLEQGKAAARQGRAAATSAAFSMAGTILGGAGQLQGLKAPPSGGTAAFGSSGGAVTGGAWRSSGFGESSGVLKGVFGG